VKVRTGALRWPTTDSASEIADLAPDGGYLLLIKAMVLILISIYDMINQYVIPVP
jgi:hypothetical protein